MGDVVIEHSGTPRCEALNLQNFTTSENDADLVQSFHGGYLPEDGTCVEKSTSTEALDRGYLEYGYVLRLFHDGKLMSILYNHSWLIFDHVFCCNTEGVDTYHNICLLHLIHSGCYDHQLISDVFFSPAVHTIGVDVALEPHAAMRYLTAGIVIMKLR